jgi:hypothetical protein
MEIKFIRPTGFSMLEQYWQVQTDQPWKRFLSRLDAVERSKVLKDAIEVKDQDTIMYLEQLAN